MSGCQTLSKALLSPQKQYSNKYSYHQQVFSYCVSKLSEQLWNRRFEIQNDYNKIFYAPPFLPHISNGGTHRHPSAKSQ